MRFGDLLRDLESVQMDPKENETKNLCHSSHKGLSESLFFLNSFSQKENH